jgi:hypothetical protein
VRDELEAARREADAAVAAAREEVERVKREAREEVDKVRAEAADVKGATTAEREGERAQQRQRTQRRSAPLVAAALRRFEP